MLMAMNDDTKFPDCLSPATEKKSEADCAGESFNDSLSIDLDSLLSILDEDQGSDHPQLQNNPEEVQHIVPEYLSGATQVECPPHDAFYKNSDFPSDFEETEGVPLLRADVAAISSEMGRPDCWVGNTDTVFEPAEVDLSAQVTLQAEASGSFEEWPMLGSGSHYFCTERAVHHSEYDMQGCSEVSGVADEYKYQHQVTDCKSNLDPAWGNYGNEFHSDALNFGIDPKCASERPSMEQSNVEFRNCDRFIRNYTGTSEVFENNSYMSVESSFVDTDISSRNATSTESVCQSSDGVTDCYYNNMSDEGMNMNLTGMVDFQNESASCSSRVSSNARVERADKSFCKQLMHGGSDAEGLLMWDRLYIHSIAQTASMKDEMQNLLLAPINKMRHSTQTIQTAVSNRFSFGVDEILFPKWGSEQLSAVPQNHGSSPIDVKEGVTQAGKRIWHSSVPQKFHAYSKHENDGVIPSCKRARNSYEMVDGVTRSSIDSSCMNMKSSERYLPYHPHSVLCKPESGNIKGESQSHLSRSIKICDLSVSPESFCGDTSGCNVQVEDDSDVCIIKEVTPVRGLHSIALQNSQVASGHVTLFDSHVASQHPTMPRAVRYTRLGGSRPRVNDERSIFHVALQDLSQPKSEATLPDGFLAVPLMRHQRIALSWMIQKETKSLHCSGGILADDQGLGKTVSTISLILKERPSTSRVREKDTQQGMLETLNLDEDDDTFIVKEKLESTNNLMQPKGRPAAGTLVVCPTSVLRQWADELQNKVTSKAKLSVLVYHGSNRTKDPSELAKYDVVLTTYAIVSMEVPKQPFSDKDDQEEKVCDGLTETSAGASSFSKSRQSSGFNKKSSKKNKDSTLLESLARPLAKVGWFRVILDEAQSIKNHRTQVARACWGLRAKRRWCLSGTPIQNTVDDLYSYFRFLRYDPYSVYKTFCNAIKFPISRNPVRGYKKLQAVLKTIMLRRTKGTLLDGKPIITLPPKFIELKKVEFSWEERDFYSRLEADSRAQFAEYAAAGTVKQNYVNILLMLLRLRQACDHPLLVRKYDSGSAWKSSVDMVKKLPQEKQQFLLNCLEGSLAICGICNDPPEDAMVTICGHVFCNQCICEHLTLDDRKCPAANCEERLSGSFVFSKVTLTNSLSQQSGLHSSPNCLTSEHAEGVLPFFEDDSYESIKIKAAIEVLKVLRPQHCAPNGNSVLRSPDKNTSLESSCDPQPNKVLNYTAKDQNLSPPAKVTGEKAIVFSQWTRMLDLLEARLKKSDIQYRRLDGTMSVAARDKAVKDFNTIPEVSVVIMSLKAASLGLNMVSACHVILLDLWWNPTTEDQAVDRAHRIGQTRPVKVLRLTVKDTVEDRILALQQKKRDMVASAFGEDETGSRTSRLTVEDLKYLFMV